MISYLSRRVVHALLTLFGILTFAFVLIHAVPGDPVSFAAHTGRSRAVPREVLEAARREYHLDEPIAIQYVSWMRRMVSLDLGRSFVDQRPVYEKIAEKVPNTFFLNLAAFLGASVLALAMGIASASPLQRSRRRGVSFSILYSLPNFWVALLLIEVAAVRFDILPLYGMVSDGHDELSTAAQLVDRLRHLILPAVTLGYAQFALFARFAVTSLDEVITKDYIVTARAKGVSSRGVVVRHALRNAMIPLVSLLGLAVPLLLSGSVIVEQIFQWDGIGSLYFQSLLARDYPTIMGLTVITAVVTLLASLVTDLLYFLVDPRIRIEEGR
ncbi:MAG TPA: ABC transporter permease [Thermoanaerobaculia bacterium]|nr:ABC transporter permease [Thermoanaerobaculia bacterium]